MRKIVKVDASNPSLILKFLENAGKSLTSFRYFNSRDLSVLKNHVATLILVDHGEPVGYGHLDCENDTVWLGIAVIEKETGKGHGKEIMSNLVACAREANLATIKLSVDKTNIAGINLYKKFGFVQSGEKENIFFFTLNLPQVER